LSVWPYPQAGSAHPCLAAARPQRRAWPAVLGLNRAAHHSLTHDPQHLQTPATSPIAGPIQKFGSAEQKKEWLAPYASGQKLVGQPRHRFRLTAFKHLSAPYHPRARRTVRRVPIWSVLRRCSSDAHRMRFGALAPRSYARSPPCRDASLCLSRYNDFQ